MSSRAKLTEALSQYVSETFTDIKIIGKFIHNHEEWKKDRESESKAMVEIKTRNNKMNSEKELSVVLDQTLSGLQPMQEFLNAVEKLSVTSVHVFQPNSAVNMSEEQLRGVQEIINDCVKICPLLLLFKRDNKAFFSPSLQNLDALQHQLDTYIINIHYICRQFKNSPLSVETPDLQLNVYLSEEDMNNMLTHIYQLQTLRDNEAFRTVFLFQGEHRVFLREYSERRSKMEGFLREVEKCATELDNMKKGKQISGVVSGSLGATGGVLAIIGIALLPVTFGASSVLIGTGAGMAGVSGATGLATVAADAIVNNRETGKANSAFEKFKDDVNALQKCLNNIINTSFNKGERSGMEDMLHFGSAVTKAAQTASQIVKAAATTADAVSKVARVGFIAVNVLFVGFDVATIVHNSVELHKGEESESSKMIRARASLWRSEIDSWEKIYQSLEQGLQSSGVKENLLKEPFWVKAKGLRSY